MLKIVIMLVLCQLGLQSVSCNNQHYSGSLPQSYTSCTLPEFPGNGRYTVLGAPADTHPGAVVPNLTVIQYNCDVGYVLYSHSAAVCNGGIWDTHFTKCQKKVTCPLPTNPAHGSYELSGLGSPLEHGTEVPNWTTAIYSCDATFEIVGNRTALCYNGIWTTEPSQCQKTTACVVPDAPAKGSYSILGSQDAPVAGSTVKENQVLLYDCPAANILQGGSVIYCRNGKWLPEIPSCMSNKPCTLPAVPVNGRIINSVGDVDHSLPGIQVPSLTGVEYSCDATFELTGIASISCYDGSWSSEPPQCQRNTNCILPDLPVTGSYSIVGSVEAPVPGAAIAENKTLRYNCTTKNTGVTEQVIVCSDGKWLPGVVDCLDTPADCGDILSSTSGIYTIQPTMQSEPFEIFCDLTLTGQKWTVIQQRFNGEVDFYRNYTEYSDGFGSKTDSHWLGLKHIHEITKGGHHELYIELETHNGTKAYARYETFIVGSSSTGFQLTISGYSGTAGNSMYDPYGWNGRNLNGMKFSTYDKDQDGWSGNCAEARQGAWWFNNCGSSNLNGLYTAEYVWSTMIWFYNFDTYALKTARMLIRRK